MSNINFPEEILETNSLQTNTDIKNVKEELKKRLIRIFQIDDNDRLKSFEEFAENKDHGLEHSLHVYKKALEITTIMEAKGYKIDKSKLFVMSFMHDSGRFHFSEEKPKKRERCEKRHNKCGIGQIRLAKNKLKKQGIIFDENFWNDINDYINNHDFLNDRLDPNYTEPKNIEGQIVRLSDRISTDIETEIDRYWETGKRLKTPYFIEDISFEERINFNFTKIGEYIKSKKFDEFTFFLALISVSEKDYQNDDLKEIYASWAESKNIGIKKILDIGRQEGFSQEQIEKMKALINDYIKHFNINY